MVTTASAVTTPPGRCQAGAGTEPDEDQQDRRAHRGLVTGQDAATHRPEDGPGQNPASGWKGGGDDLGATATMRLMRITSPSPVQDGRGVPDEGRSDDHGQGQQTRHPGVSALVEETGDVARVARSPDRGPTMGRPDGCTAPRYWRLRGAFSGVTDFARSQTTTASPNSVRPRLSRIELLRAVAWPPAATPTASRASLASTLRASRATDADAPATRGTPFTMETLSSMTPQQAESQREHGPGDHHGCRRRSAWRG